MLAVSSDASGTVRTTLRSLLDALRLDPDAWTANPLSKADEKCIATYRAVVEELFKTHSGVVYDQKTFVAFSRRVFIREFAVGTGQGHEKAALALLSKEARVPPELIWTYLVGQSLRFAAERCSVTRDNLNELIGPYSGPSATSTPQLTMQLAIKMTGTMSSGREVILIEGFPNEEDVAVMEFFRFDADGRKRLRFRGQTAFWSDKIAPNGSKLFHRTATMRGMKRYVDTHRPALEERHLVILAANDIEAQVHSPSARAHAALLDRMLNENRDLLKCLHCAKPLSQEWMTLVEVDDEDNPPAVGAVHDTCLRAVDRVLGQLQCPTFVGQEFLKKFDVKRWIELRLHGQGAFNAGIATRTGYVEMIGWNPINEAFREDSSCIEIALSDGTTRHVMSRGKLDRYDFETASVVSH